MSLGADLNPITGAARAWLLPAVMLGWLLIMGSSLGTLYGVYRLGERQGITATQLAQAQSASQAAAEGEAQERAKAREIATARASTAAATARAQAAERSLQEEIRRYAPADAAVPCLDPDGLRLWRKANALAHPASADALAGGPTGVPAAAAAREQQRAGAAGQPRAGDHAVSPVPRPPQGASRAPAGDRQ